MWTAWDLWQPGSFILTLGITSLPSLFFGIFHVIPLCHGILHVFFYKDRMLPSLMGKICVGPQKEKVRLVGAMPELVPCFPIIPRTKLGSSHLIEGLHPFPSSSSLSATCRENPRRAHLRGEDQISCRCCGGSWGEESP